MIAGDDAMPDGRRRRRHEEVEARAREGQLRYD